MRQRIGAFSALLFLAALLGSGCSSASAIPAFSAPVVDDAQLIDAATEQRLNVTLEEFRLRQGPQIAVLVVSTTGDKSIEDYSIDVARTWGVGDATRDDGILVVVAIDDRELRIETGSGIEGDLTDVQAAAVLEQMKPALRTNDPGTAVDVGVTAIIDTLSGVLQPQRQPSFRPGPAPESSTPLPVTPDPGRVLAAILGILIGAVAGVVAYLSATGSRQSTGGSSWWSSGGFFGGGGGFSGGGFSGGFGGGFSGGGASGSW